MTEESNLAQQLDNKNKFSEEELNELKEIQDEYYKIQTQFGQLSVAKIRLDEQLEKLHKTEDENIQSFKDIQEKERNFLDGITEKYGEGTLNPETGEFTPNK
jgi:predicted nuclease with TOPRIM domain|tara:strand:- start:176 stop:481 length:306 start_codon:yes stop_codon:yes gene_type:complete